MSYLDDVRREEEDARIKQLVGIEDAKFLSENDMRRLNRISIATMTGELTIDDVELQCGESGLAESISIKCYSTPFIAVTLSTVLTSFYQLFTTMFYSHFRSYLLG